MDTSNKLAEAGIHLHACAHQENFTFEAGQLEDGAERVKRGRRLKLLAFLPLGIPWRRRLGVALPAIALREVVFLKIVFLKIE